MTSPTGKHSGSGKNLPKRDSESYFDDAPIAKTGTLHRFSKKLNDDTRFEDPGKYRFGEHSLGVDRSVTSTSQPGQTNPHHTHHTYF